MNPGRELDALVAEKVFGCKIVEHQDFISFIGESVTEPGCGCDGMIHMTNPRFPRYHMKPYSTSISAAWEIVTKLNRWCFSFQKIINLRTDFKENPFNYTAIFDPVLIKDRKNLLATSYSAPHAICLAALKAVGHVFKE